MVFMPASTYSHCPCVFCQACCLLLLARLHAADAACRFSLPSMPLELLYRGFDGDDGKLENYYNIMENWKLL